MSTSRPRDDSTCPTYDNWPEGFNNYSDAYTYDATLVDTSRAAVIARYNSRKIGYARGLLDNGDDSSSCAPVSQGANRNERFFEFIKQFPVNCTNFATCGTVDFVNVGV